MLSHANNHNEDYYSEDDNDYFGVNVDDNFNHDDYHKNVSDDNANDYTNRIFAHPCPQEVSRNLLKEA